MKAIGEIFRLFFYTGWKRQCLILLAMLLGVAAENLSIASLWPIVGVASGEGIKPSPATEVVTRLLDTVGLSPTLGALLLFLCVTITLKFALSSAGLIYVGREVARMSTHMRLRLIEAIVRARWSHIISTPAGRLSAALSDEAERAQAAYRASGNFAARLTETVTYLIGCLWISWEFSVAAIVAAAILWLAVARFVAMARRAGRAKWRSVHLLSSAVNDLLTSIKSLRAMNRQAYLGRFASAQVDALRKASMREYYSEAAVRALQEPLLGSMVIGGFYVGYTYFNLGLVELIGVVWLLRRISNGVSTMRGAMQRVAIDGVAFWSIIRLTDDMNAQAEALHGGKEAHLRKQCDFRDVSFGYGDKTIVTVRQLRAAGGRGGDPDRPLGRRQDHDRRPAGRPARAGCRPGPDRRPAAGGDSTSRAGAARSAISRRRTSCSTTRCWRTSRSATRRSAKSRRSRPCAWRAPGASSRPCRAACTR